MITLITGGPGLGKTAHAVDILQKLYVGKTVFSNIRELKIEHSKLPKVEEWTVSQINDQGTQEHKFSFPPGSIIVIDECQDFFRPRASGSKVPPYIQAFETHRHTGVDFILITQGPNLVDANLRALIRGGKHVHLRSTWMGRYSYESSECIDVESKASLAQCSRRKYKLPTHVFDQYKSAELHTKPPKPRLPMQAYVLVGVLIVGSVLAYRFGFFLKDKIDPAAAIASTGTPGEAQPTTSGTGALTASTAIPGRIIEAMTPTDDQNPLSAPLYAAVVPQVVAPEIVGCIASKRSCSCYTQQSTPLWLPEPQCRQRAAGLYFDPYRQPPSPSESKTRPAYASSVGTEATAPDRGSSRAPSGPVPRTSSRPPDGEPLT